MTDSGVQNDPVLASLERLHARLDQLEGRLGRMEARLDAVGAPLERVAAEAPGAVAMFTDTMDSFAARIGNETLADRVVPLAHAVERLTHPDTLRVLDALLDRADRVEAALALLDQAPGTVAMFADSFDQMADRVAATGIPLHERVDVLLAAAERLSSPSALEVLRVVTGRLEEVKGLLESGVLDPEAVRVVSMAGRALVASRACECGPVGPMGALGALREAPIQRALGFAVAFARQFGIALDSPPALPAPRN
jgi:uncharacterized protein YjgD (DUF1641 family)